MKTPLDTYNENLDYRNGLKLLKARMTPNEYKLEYRRADRRVQRSKMTLRKLKIEF